MTSNVNKCELGKGEKNVAYVLKLAEALDEIDARSTVLTR
jgi:hypothetical protein